MRAPRVAVTAASLALAVSLAAATLVLASPSRLAAQGELFEQGNQLYQRGDFPGAIDAYEAVLEAGWASGVLHYNLGNAYFKAGELGRAILAWERSLALSPRDPDALANLELARTLTADAVDPLPSFWLLDLVSWWVHLIPRRILLALVGAAWLAAAAGTVVRILTRSEDGGRWGARLAIGSVVVVVVLGTNLLVRELGIGRAERGVVLAEAVPVRSAPADDDDLTLFEIHEGTRVRVDQRAGAWAEIVLDDGKVGWVPADAFEEI